jgi:hypothetical protein
MGSLGALELVAVAAVAALGAIVQGAAGFGLSLVAVPFLVLIEPKLVPGPLMFAALALTLLMAARGRGEIHVRGVAWAVVGRVPGVVAGAATLAVLPQSELTVLFGAIVIVAVIMTASGLTLQPKRGTLLAAGALSGFMGTTAAIGGPPLALVYQHHAGPALRSTLAGYFVIGASMSLIGLAVVHRFGWEELSLSLVLLPGILLGYFASLRLTGWLDRGRTRAAVLWVSAGSALLVIVQQLG